MYAKPAWCLAPPFHPLPPAAPQPEYLNAEATVEYSGLPGTPKRWTRLFKRIPKAAPSLYTAEQTIAGNTLRIEVVANYTTKRLGVTITALAGGTLYAAISWNTVPLPEAPFWERAFDAPNFQNPTLAAGTARVWV
jgi:hypothetical protein